MSRDYSTREVIDENLSDILSTMPEARTLGPQERIAFVGALGVRAICELARAIADVADAIRGNRG